MKELLISGEIGWDTTAETVRRAIQEIPTGEDVRIVIDSPGGSCYEMVSIFNLIRDFARNNLQKIETYIQGLAASAASMIALAAKAGNENNKIIVEDNSIFMIHNCWTVEIGDHRAMEEAARACLRIDEQQRNIYQNRTKKARKEIQDLMDATTYFYGDEIVEAGFADEVIKSGEDQTNLEVFTSQKDSKILSAKIRFDNMKKDMQSKQEDVKKMKIAAMDCDLFKDSTSYVRSENIQLEGSSLCEGASMNKEEFKAKYPELYSAIYEESFKAGVDAERKRVQSHIKMATDSGDVNAAMDFIASGVSCSDNEATAKYHEVFTKTALAKARASDVVPDTTVAGGTEDSEMNAKMNAFFAETGLVGE